MLKTFVLFLPMMAFAADPAGFTIWKASDLKGFEKKLSSKMDAQKVATQNLSNYGNHLAMIAHREGNGQAELHVHTVDVFVIESGEATLVIGGSMPDSKTTAPGEVRAPNVEGGSKHVVSAGDIVHIPANIPHQMLVETGKEVTYFVVKVETK